uniref:Odorant binding protein 7 n=1 Tax=Colaphellus bowringi TaxID=561076 RepID=A0A0S3J2L4_9CUCU|nr:odorant binding protein 7 [Colaphellus bowringi]
MLRKFDVFVLGLLLTSRGVSGLSEEMQELADMLHATCVHETGARQDDIENARKGIFAEDEKFKCYIKCIMAQMACIDEDGIIDEDATIAVLPEEYRNQAEPVIKKCGTKKGSNPCENAWLTHKCYQNEAPEDYFLV